MNAFCNKLSRINCVWCLSVFVQMFLRRDNCRNCHRVEGFIRALHPGDSDATHLSVVPTAAAAVLTLLQCLLKMKILANCSRLGLGSIKTRMFYQLLCVQFIVISIQGRASPLHALESVPSSFSKHIPDRRYKIDSCQESSGTSL